MTEIRFGAFYCHECDTHHELIADYEDECPNCGGGELEKLGDVDETGMIVIGEQDE